MWSLATFFKIIVASMVVFTVASCGAATSTLSESDSSDSDSTTSAAPVGGNVSGLTATDAGAEITLSDISSDDEIVVMLYSLSSDSTALAFEMSSSESAQPSLAFKSLEQAADASSNEVAVVDGDATESFHLKLRAYEANLDHSAALAQSNAAPAPSLIKYATVGSSRTFKVLNSFSSSSSYDTVTATLRYENEDFQFYVDTRDSAAVDDADLETMADQFSAAIPLERDLFGEESDINGDGKFAVLFTQTVNSLGASSGGMVTGFFYAVDLFDSSSYPISNEMEVYYTFVPDPQGEYGSAVSKSFAMSNIYPGVLPHEFQHMISFNLHYNINAGSAETGWLNEGLSHLAEDIHTADDDGYMEFTGDENPARVATYLSNVENICFTCGTSLSQRGGSYLFVRYLYEQAQLGNLPNVSSGFELLGTLLDTSLRGTDNIIAAAYGAAGTDDDLKNILGLFGLALYLSNTDLTTDNRLGFTGIDLRATQNDNRGTVLSGPSIQTATSLPFTDTLAGTGFTFIQLSGDTIQSNGGRLSFTFSDSSVFGGYVIKN